MTNGQRYSIRGSLFDELFGKGRELQSVLLMELAEKTEKPSRLVVQVNVATSVATSPANCRISLQFGQNFESLSAHLP